MQDLGPIFIWLFLPLAVDIKPFSEELKPDPLLVKIPIVPLFPAKLCCLTPAQSLACVILQEVPISRSPWQIKAPFPFSIPFPFSLWEGHTRHLGEAHCAH